MSISNSKTVSQKQALDPSIFQNISAFLDHVVEIKYQGNLQNAEINKTMRIF